MRTSLYLKTGAEIQAVVEARMTDTGNALATDAQYVAGISEGILMWAGRVIVPQYYALSSGFTSGTYEYTLPAYINPPFLVQIKSDAFNFQQGLNVSSSNTFTWHTFAGYTVEPTATGGKLIRLPIVPYSEDGRILWWAENGPLPATAPTLTDGVTASDTSAVLTVTGSPDLHESGFVKIESEWLSYGGLTRTSSTSYTLTNLVRGLYGTTAAIHASTTAVSWGVAADDQRLWVQLYDYVTAYAHALQMHKGTTEDINRHEKLMSYYGQKAAAFWRTEGYVPGRKHRTNVTTESIGPISW